MAGAGPASDEEYHRVFVTGVNDFAGADQTSRELVQAIHMRRKYLFVPASQKTDPLPADLFS